MKKLVSDFALKCAYLFFPSILAEEDETTVEATNNDEEEKGKVVKLSRSRGPLVTLYRFWNRKNTDHFYTTNPAKYCLDGYKSRGSLCKRYRDYRYAKNVGRIYKRRYGKVKTLKLYLIRFLYTGNIVYPLYRAYNSRIRDHFYTTNCQEVLRAQKHGWKYQGVEGYCFKQYLPGINSPLYRYWRPGKDHFYTTNRNMRYWGMASSVARKYKYEGVACYVVI